MIQHPSAAPGLLVALASASVYGLSICYTRLAALAGVDGPSLVVYRVALMLAAALGLAVLLRLPLRVPRTERGALALAGAASVVIGLAYLSSVAFIPVTVAVVIFYTFPILIVLASPLVEGTRLTGALLAVAGAALLGVGLVVGPAFDGLDPRGIVLAIMASGATATQFFAVGRLGTTTTVAKLTWIHIIVLPPALAIALALGGLAPPAALAAAALPVGMTLAGYTVGFALQIVALTRASAVVAGIAFCAEPVAATVASAFLLGEALAPIQALGGALVLAAIMANVILEHRRSRPPAATPPPGAPRPDPSAPHP